MKNSYTAGEISGIPYVDKYLYLGVYINNQGNLKLHRTKLLGKVIQIG